MILGFISGFLIDPPATRAMRLRFERHVSREEEMPCAYWDALTSTH